MCVGIGMYFFFTIFNIHIFSHMFLGPSIPQCYIIYSRFNPAGSHPYYISCVGDKSTDWAKKYGSSFPFRYFVYFHKIWRCGRMDSICVLLCVRLVIPLSLPIFFLFSYVQKDVEESFMFSCIGVCVFVCMRVWVI